MKFKIVNMVRSLVLISSLFLIFNNMAIPAQAYDGIITLISPSNNAINPKTLNWSAADGAEKYNVVLATDFACTNKIYNINVTSLYFYLPVSLADGTYFWQLCAYDAEDNKGQNTEVRNFLIVAGYPETPTNPTWSEGNLHTDLNITATWNDASSSSLINSYYLQVDVNSTDFSTGMIFNSLTGSNQKNFTLNAGNGLLDNHTYYFRVAGRNNVGITGGYSIISAGILIDLTIPHSPTLLSPTNGFLSPTNQSTFTWSAVEYAALYHIQVADEISFTSPLINATTSDTSFSTLALGNGTYFWRVRAVNARGHWGTNSAVWNVIKAIIPSTSPDSSDSDSDSSPSADNISISSYPIGVSLIGAIAGAMIAIRIKRKKIPFVC